MIYRRNSLNHSSNRSNRSISNSDSFNPYAKITCYTCGDIVHKSFNYRKFSYGKWILRPKYTKHQGPKNTWAPKK